VLALAILWVLLVPATGWLAHHDVSSAKGSLNETALDNARSRLLTLTAGLLAAGALLFTALNFNLLRRNSEQADQWQRRAHDLTEQGQMTDRYTKAIDQLGSKELDVRIGGIYALERIARDSPRDHPTVMEVLAAFIREHSHEQWQRPETRYTVTWHEPRPDVQAALTVIGRRNADCDQQPIDLILADLAGADLTKANLAKAKLTRARLTSARLTGAKLTGAHLASADLSGAYLTDADFTGAFLDGASFTDAIGAPRSIQRDTLEIPTPADSTVLSRMMDDPNN
jgi:hypothetical protein